jgi:hypothetical protein
MKPLIVKIFCSLILLLYINLLMAQNPNWQPPLGSNYANTSSVIAQIKLSDIASNNVDDRIAFFVGNELRGLSKAINKGSGQYIHFITLYSNTALEAMKVKVYHKLTNRVYEVATPFEFKVQGITGSIDNPFVVKIYPNNNSPLSILPVPPQTTMRTIPFSSIDMAAYLVQPDSFPVEWSILPNPNLISFFDGSVLHISGANGFVGQTALTVRATELSTATLESMHASNERSQSNTQSAETIILCTVTPLWNAPKWQPSIPSQGIVVGSQFSRTHLDLFENQYNGSAIMYDYRPIITESSPALASPSWTVSDTFGVTMTVTASIDYTPKYQFHHVSDVLGAFINGELRGVAEQDSASGLYFLSIGGDSHSSDTIELLLYSGAMKQILHLQEKLIYAPFKILGSPDAPFHMDFAPILPIVPEAPVPGGIALLALVIIDPSFTGSVAFEFIAADPTYPTVLHDETLASFCVVADSADLVMMYEDADGDGLGNPNVSIQTCVEAQGYVTNDDDCDDTHAEDPMVTISISETSGSTPNDGFVCGGALVILTATGGQSYQWSTGSTNASADIRPISTATYKVTVTHAAGCLGIRSVEIIVEGKVVKNGANAGEGSLRNVLECLIEGDTITYDQPTNNRTILTAVLIVNKDAVIQGLSNLRPEIAIDFNTAVSGININTNKKLTLDNIDLRLFNVATKKTFIGPGSIEISGFSSIRN